MAGVRQVNLVCLESLEEMPADTMGILEGQEEGVTRHNSCGPREVLVEEERNGRKFVRGVRFARCTFARFNSLKISMSMQSLKPFGC